MKVSVNLATWASSRERYAFAWAIPLGLAALAILAALGYSTLFNYREYRKIEVSLNNLVLQEQELQKQETGLKKDLDLPQNHEMYDKAHFVNDLIEQRQVSMAAVMESVSKVLPPSVRLTSLTVSHQKGSIGIRMAVMGKDEDALETLMGNLEDAKEFADLTVANQGGAQAASLTSGGTIGLICTARFVGEGAQ